MLERLTEETDACATGCVETGNRSPCGDCPNRVVCRCLKVTESVLRSALVTFDLRTVKDVRRATGAGDGCTACHRLLQRYLNEHAQSCSSSSAEPICSVR